MPFCFLHKSPVVNPLSHSPYFCPIYHTHHDHFKRHLTNIYDKFVRKKKGEPKLPCKPYLKNPNVSFNFELKVRTYRNVNGIQVKPKQANINPWFEFFVLFNIEPFKNNTHIQNTGTVTMLWGTRTHMNILKRCPLSCVSDSAHGSL